MWYSSDINQWCYIMTIFSLIFPALRASSSCAPWCQMMLQFSGSTTWPWPWLDPQLKLRQRQLHKIIMSMVWGETDPNFRKSARFSHPGINLPISWKRCKELIDCKICCFLCRPVDEKNKNKVTCFSQKTQSIILSKKSSSK